MIPSGSFSHNLRPTLALLLVVAIWGATFTVVKQALSDASTLLFLAMRFSLAMAVMTSLLRRRPADPFRLRQSVKGGLIAGLALFGGYFFQTAGLRYTSAPNSAFITSLSVVAVPLLSAIFLKTLPGARELGAVATASIGLALLITPPGSSPIGIGDILTVFCAISFGAHVVILARFAPACSLEVLSFTQIATTAVISLATFWWAETPYLRWTPRLSVALPVTGILATALAFTVQTWAQRRLSPVRIALILTLEPVFAWITAFLVAGESLGGWKALGALLILAGGLLVELQTPSTPLRLSDLKVTRDYNVGRNSDTGGDR